MRTQLKLNMLSGVALALGSAAVMAVSYPLYLRYLGYEQYGLWLVLSTVVSFAQLGNLGIGPAVAKQVAEENARQNLEGVRSCVTTAMLLLTLSGSIVLALLCLLQPAVLAVLHLAPQQAAVARSLFVPVSILSVYVFCVDSFNATLSGLGRMDLANVGQLAAQVAGVTAAMTCLWMGKGVHSLLIASFVSYAVLQICSAVMVRRIVGGPVFNLSTVTLKRAGALIRFGSCLMGSSLLTMLLSPFNKLMLSWFAGLAAVPVYEIAFSGCMKVRSLVEFGLKAMMPEISRMRSAKGSGLDISTLYRNCFGKLLVWGAPAYVLAFLLADSLVSIWLKESADATIPRAVRITLVGSFLSLLGVPAFYTLMGLGHATELLVGNIVQTGANIVLIGLLVLSYSTLSVESILTAVSLAMALASGYLIWRNRIALTKLA